MVTDNETLGGEEVHVENSSTVVVEDSKTTNKAKSTTKRPASLPLSRIKQIMKLDPDVHMASTESVYLIAKSAEVFVDMLTKEALTYTQSSKKKTIQKKDIESAINNCDQLSFLEATLE